MPKKKSPKKPSKKLPKKPSKESSNSPSEKSTKELPRLDYLRFRVAHHCRCGGTSEIVTQPNRNGWLECCSCGLYIRLTYAASIKILNEVI